MRFFQSFSFQTQQTLQKVNVGAVQQGEWDALEKNRTQSSVNAVRLFDDWRVNEELTAHVTYGIYTVFRLKSNKF